MLTTALQQSIKIDVTEYLGVKEYAYTCYGDSDSKDIFYVVPEDPGCLPNGIPIRRALCFTNTAAKIRKAATRNSPCSCRSRMRK